MFLRCQYETRADEHITYNWSSPSLDTVLTSLLNSLIYKTMENFKTHIIEEQNWNCLQEELDGVLTKADLRWFKQNKI